MAGRHPSGKMLSMFVTVVLVKKSSRLFSLWFFPRHLSARWQVWLHPQGVLPRHLLTSTISRRPIMVVVLKHSLVRNACRTSLKGPHGRPKGIHSQHVDDVSCLSNAEALQRLYVQGDCFETQTVVANEGPVASLLAISDLSHVLPVFER